LLPFHPAVPLRFAVFLITVTFGISPALPAGQAANELLAALQSRLVAGRSLDDLGESLEQLENQEFRDLIADLDKAWPKLRDSYLQTLETAAKGLGGSSGDQRSRVRELRGDFMRVKAMGEGAMKEQLKKVSKPALDELQRLLTPTPDQIVSSGGDPLPKLRKTATDFARFRDQALDAALSTQPSDTLSSLQQAEQKVAYVGLNALVLDPKLCTASRDHSQDMKEKNFFAHNSPVPGKESPWQRAKLAGTTASAENIYSGGSNPSGANKGWFFSPGHHKNMFGGHRRIGLGHYGGRWTQMFGK
jgi:uncharacterized protein YkwD